MTDLQCVGLFSGVGGIELAMHRNGIQTIAMCEIDAAATRVLNHRFPGVPVFDDVRKVTGDALRDLGAVPERTVLTGGFPCTDLALCGRRAGMDRGTRSGLFWEIDRVLGEFPAAWVVLENVPGLLSSTCPCPGDGLCVARGLTVRCPGELHAVPGGACGGDGCIAIHGGAMGAVLGSLGDRGYGFAYRVLDSRFFGVPQRRRRVVIVGRRAGGAGTTAPAQVLLEPESCSGDPAAGATPRQVPAPRTTDGTGGTRDAEVVNALTSSMAGAGGGVDDNTAQGGHLVVEATGNWQRVAATLNSGGSAGGFRTEPGEAPAPTAVGALTTRCGNSQDDQQTTQLVVAFSHTAGIDPQASEHVTPTVMAGHDRMPADSGHAVVRRLTPLECERLQGFPAVHEWQLDVMSRDEFAAALLAAGHVTVDTESGTVYRHRGPGGVAIPPRIVPGSDVNGYLAATFKLNADRRQIRLHRLVWIAAYGIPPEGMAVCHLDDDKTNNRIANLYLATPEENSSDAAATGRYLIGERNPSSKITESDRALMVAEYERGDVTLRQLADKYGISKSRVGQIVKVTGWTDVPGATDSARYKQCGNAVTVNVFEWVFGRLVAVDADLRGEVSP